MPRVRLDVANDSDGAGEPESTDIRIDTDVFRALSVRRALTRRRRLPTINRWFDCWRS